jgi:iron complex outermembrane receptor protein
MKNFSTTLFRLSSLTTALIFSLNTHADNIEKIVVTATHLNTQINAEATVKVTDPDLSSWLTSVPGANINRNGAVTGIAQYRGLFGDRVSTTINGHNIIGSGPNAMDSPLSYGPTFLVESMSVYQGIAPVSAGLDTLGGAIEVTTLKADISHSSNLTKNGQLRSAYRDNNAASNISGLVNLSQGDFALLAYADWQKGDDIQTGDNLFVTPTRYKKHQAGTDVRYQSAQSEIGFSYHYTDTENSGTPALPMDISYIYAHRLSVDGNTLLNDWQINWQLGYLDSLHEMDNFSERTNINSMSFRTNNADAQTIDFKFTAEQAQWLLGVDGYIANHNATITNPNNAQFTIENFNAVKDKRLGFFLQWQHQFDKLSIDTGARVKFISANSGEVSHYMAMMNPAINNLLTRFNNSDRDVADTTLDFASNFIYSLSVNNQLSLGLAIKQRAPAYQERYLWIPMEATGGLADGNTYIGNINLASETAYQLDLGLHSRVDNWQLSAHTFYQKINDYIQGISSTNTSANMLATMMTGKTPLQYANVDAILYGLDGRASYQLTDQLQLITIASYVRGKRDDINDNLYRIAPLNGQFKLVYQQQHWQANMALIAYAAQTKVSLTNREEKSSGYAFVNIDVSYDFTEDFIVKAGVDNLFDRNYKSHLGGYNRVQDSDIAFMSRLPAQGRNIWLEFDYYF